jgi:putative nucleotidyltransferase with HDIG domain
MKVMAIDLERLLARVESLPTLPTVAHKVGELVNDPDTDSNAIAAVMKEDQSLTARVLALANSAYYAIPGGVGDIRRAISYLGFNTVYQLVLTASIFKVLPTVPGTGFDVKQLWKHSLGAGIAAEAISKHLRFGKPEEVFTAGLLHDIGKVALASFSAETMATIVTSAMQGGLTYAESEREQGVIGHAEIGRRLAEKWRLPETIHAGISYHHKLDPAKRVTLPRHLHPIADVVALADVLCRREKIGSGGDEIIPTPDRELLERLNLTAISLQKIQDQIPAAIERSRIFLELLGS